MLAEEKSECNSQNHPTFSPSEFLLFIQEVEAAASGKSEGWVLRYILLLDSLGRKVRKVNTHDTPLI